MLSLYNTEKNYQCFMLAILHIIIVDILAKVQGVTMVDKCIPGLVQIAVVKLCMPAQCMVAAVSQTEREKNEKNPG